MATALPSLEAARTTAIFSCGNLSASTRAIPNSLTTDSAASTQSPESRTVDSSLAQTPDRLGGVRANIVGQRESAADFSAPRDVNQR